ncbi:MAG: hypothetical protein M3511_15235 [Deinococcota bacterium]|jgi:hypothetical protein|nr:hypothetical protein [Deinococcota bacterium]
MPSSAQDKKRTTIYIAPDVLEYLAIRRAKGGGSVSQQLEDLVRASLAGPRTTALSRKETAKLEAKEVEGYTKHPLTSEELDDWLDEQVWDE